MYIHYIYICMFIYYSIDVISYKFDRAGRISLALDGRVVVIIASYRVVIIVYEKSNVQKFRNIWHAWQEIYFLMIMKYTFNYKVHFKCKMLILIFLTK